MTAPASRGDETAAGPAAAPATPATVRATVFLKSLTLKGFKSFADATTLQLEPGVTVVVGPNGSGKSNVVDAIALGARCPGAVGRAQPEDGRRDLRRHRQAAGPRAGRGRPDDRQLGRPAADRVHRGDRLAHAVPHRGERIRHQRRQLPPARRPGTALRRRRRPSAARHRQPGPDRRGAQRPPGGPPLDHRGGRRRPQVPTPQGEGRAPARRHRGQPAARPGPAARGAAGSCARWSARPRRPAVTAT